jgi:hypothetical protein
MASSFTDGRVEHDAASALDLLRKVETTAKMIDANATEDRATAGITAAVFDMIGSSASVETKTVRAG